MQLSFQPLFSYISSQTLHQAPMSSLITHHSSLITHNHSSLITHFFGLYSNFVPFLAAEMTSITATASSSVMGNFLPRRIAL